MRVTDEGAVVEPAVRALMLYAIKKMEKTGASSVCVLYKDGDGAWVCLAGMEADTAEEGNVLLAGALASALKSVEGGEGAGVLL